MSEIRFTPKENFDWIEGNHLKASYLIGLFYTARAGTPWNALRAIIPEWEAAGKIEIIEAPAASKMEGKD